MKRRGQNPARTQVNSAAVRRRQQQASCRPTFGLEIYPALMPAYLFLWNPKADPSSFKDYERVCAAAAAGRPMSLAGSALRRDQRRATLPSCSAQVLTTTASSRGVQLPEVHTRIEELVLFGSGSTHFFLSAEKYRAPLSWPAPSTLLPGCLWPQETSSPISCTKPSLTSGNKAQGTGRCQ